jgi:adenine phosphoribosyltransferase
VTADQLKKKIRHVPDFPKRGILFYDITTLLRDPAGFHAVIDSLAAPFHNKGIDLVVGVESRGFIVGATYELEYGTDSLEIHDDAVTKGQLVLVVDDLLATGGTAKATLDLVTGLGGKVHAFAFLIELAGLSGRERLKGQAIHSVLTY